MKKIISIFKNLYVLLIVIMILTAIYMGGFLRNYLYDTIYNSQIVSLFRRRIPMPNDAEFKNIERAISEKNEEKQIAWEEINDPFNLDPAKKVAEAQPLSPEGE